MFDILYGKFNIEGVQATNHKFRRVIPKFAETLLIGQRDIIIIYELFNLIIIIVDE